MSPDSKLAEAVRKKNQSLTEFYKAQWEAEDIAEDIRRLLGPSPAGVDRVLATMSSIEWRLQDLEEMFQELGCIPDSGEFDTDNYRWLLVERRIANRQIRELSDVPEEFQDSFRHLFDDPSGDQPRDTEAIRDDIAMSLEVLRDETRFADDFSRFMPQGRKKGSAKLDALRDELNERWDEFKSAAKAVAYHF